MSLGTSVGSGEMSIFPDSSFERSSTSLMSPSRVLPLTMMESIACSRSSSVRSPDFSISEKPMMALSGVLMSWLTVEKK